TSTVPVSTKKNQWADEFSMARTSPVIAPTTSPHRAARATREPHPANNGRLLSWRSRSRRVARNSSESDGTGRRGGGPGGGAIGAGPATSLVTTAAVTARSRGRAGRGRRG